MTRDEFVSKNYSEFLLGMWSEPCFDCPKCGKTTVCRDNTIVYPSLPPKHRYECLQELGGCGKYSEVL